MERNGTVDWLTKSNWKKEYQIKDLAEKLIIV